MNSLKSTITVLFLLGVSYGVYRLIHTPDPSVPGNGAFFVALGPTTPQSNSRELGPNSTPAADSAARNGMSPPAPKAFASISVPNFDAPKLTDSVASQSSAGSQFHPNLANSAIAASDLPSATPLAAKLIPTIPPASQAMTVAGSSSKLNSDGQTMANASTIMSGPLTPVPAANGLKPNASVYEASPTRGIPNSEATQLSPLNSQTTKPDMPAIESPDMVQDLASVWPTVDAQIRKGEITAALQQLSGYYHANLSAADRAELLTWLDALAFKVIYSSEHRLTPTPHVVQAGETLESLAQDWNIPRDLLVNINRSKLPANEALTPGLELKIIRGPFRAEIDSRNKELTLFLDRCYAGRFAIDMTNCTNLRSGPLAVQSLRVDAPGQYCLDLVGGVRLIAGMPASGSSSIQLNAVDAKDVFGILSTNSQVTVVR